MTRRRPIESRKVEDRRADDDGVAHDDHRGAVTDVARIDLAAQVLSQIDYALAAELGIRHTGAGVDRDQLAAAGGDHDPALPRLGVGP